MSDQCVVIQISVHMKTERDHFGEEQSGTNGSYKLVVPASFLDKFEFNNRVVSMVNKIVIEAEQVESFNMAIDYAVKRERDEQRALSMSGLPGPGR